MTSTRRGDVGFTALVRISAVVLPCLASAMTPSQNPRSAIMPHQQQVSAELNACIQACLDCYRVCQQSATMHCLERDRNGHAYIRR